MTVYDYRQLSCDINVNNTVALENTKMIKVYVSLDPRVRPLIMIVKHWTKQRLLNDAGRYNKKELNRFMFVMY